jgi:hypothetical protein
VWRQVRSFCGSLKGNSDQQENGAKRDQGEAGLGLMGERTVTAVVVSSLVAS